MDMEIEEEIVSVVPELSEEDSGVANINGSEWTSVKLVPVDKIECKFPFELLKSLRQVDNGVKQKIGDVEFSVYIHGEFNDDGVFVISEDFYIPKQKVSGASVDYLEEPDNYYNGCLHKHPKGVTTFSGTDKKYINSNFDFSILYLNGKIQTGIINVPYHANRRLQSTLKIVVDNDPDMVCGFDLSNIEKRVVTHKKKDDDTFSSGFANSGTSTNPLILPHVALDPEKREALFEQDLMSFGF